MADEHERIVRLLFWNAYLLRPRIIPYGPPLPAVGRLAAPAVPERATAIGRTLAGAYDIVALAEVFDPAERKRVLEGWAGRPDATAVVGPERSVAPLANASGGLLTIADGLRLTRTDRYVFRARGERRYDADAWANKGVLLAEVDPGVGGPGRIEVFSTHLYWGTGLLGGARALDPERRRALRSAQIAELVAFVARAHRPENVAIVVGDFNVPAHDPDGPDPAGAYDELSAALGSLGLVDTWAEAGVGPGFTCGPATDPFDEDDPDAPGYLLDDPAADPAGEASRPERLRIDSVWVQRAAADHRLAVTFGRPRRRAFPRPVGAPRLADLPRLSDHLALSVELTVTPTEDVVQTMTPTHPLP